ncbi:hypothetical protein H5410_051682 [Solanum commersonii]|uniref:Uncharacterized protein n=1 Tax=Solanum commersonii TaxID=4109 RepID=A0A9J5X066_SOLCO|nr:hypothetical protein H5410_051682 [Solanum commersonii]
MESKGFKLSKTKIEYLECKFSDMTHETDVDVRIDTQVIPNRGSYKYLRINIQGNGEIDEDCTHCIEAAWMKWRLEPVLCVIKSVPPRLGGEIYRVWLDPLLLYGVECCPVKNSHVQKQAKAMTPVEDKMQEVRLRWFGHVKR